MSDFICLTLYMLYKFTIHIIYVVSETFIKWFKQGRVAGRFRFNLIYLAYKILPIIGPRDKEWEFVLNYLPQVNKDNGVVRVLDAGGSMSLFVYEIAGRGYKTTLLDQRPYQEKLPPKIKYIQGDLRKTEFESELFDYVVMVSVLEMVGLPSHEYIPSTQPYYDKDAQEKTVKEMARILCRGGKLLLTVPDHITRRASTFMYHIYDYNTISKLLTPYFNIQECTERKGRILVAASKRE